MRRLAERVRDEHGRLDVLVNDIWGWNGSRAGRRTGTPRSGGTTWTPGWILRLGVETHLITSHHLLPLLIERPGGLLVEVTDGTTEFNASRYRISVFYDLAKVAVNRLAFSQGHELAAHGILRVTRHPDGRLSRHCRASCPIALDIIELGTAVSVDSFEPATQRFALSRGAVYLNDIQGFPDPGLYAELAYGRGG